MYFILKYMEYPEFKHQPNDHKLSSTTVQPSIKSTNKSMSSKSMSLTRNSVKSKSLTTSRPSLAVDAISEVGMSCPENKEVLVNPDCFLGSIVDYIIELACIKRRDFKMCKIDGDLMDVNDGALSTPGVEVFEPFQTYYIILREHDSSGQEIFTPLLSKNCEVFQILLLKFNNTPLKKEKSSTNNSSARLSKSKETKNKRVRSAGSKKETKTTGTLPPIKQKNV